MSENNIKIGLTPLLAILAIISFFIGIGSIWNNVRTKEKLEKVRNHAEDIYRAHRSEVIELAKYPTEAKRIRQLLNAINDPEKGTYRVHIIAMIPGREEIMEDIAINSISLTNEQKNLLKDIVSIEKPTSTTKTFFSNSRRESNILAFIPIIEGENVIGFMLVEVDKSQNI